jgi:ubiquinone/menaquinone biosynthesis C-methylase UbiE
MKEKSENCNKNDRKSFDRIWNNRAETHYIHWTRTEPMNQIQLAFRNHWYLFKDIMKNTVTGNRVLEVGCGRGSMSAYFSENGFRCTLLDSSTSVIKIASEIFSIQGLKGKFCVGDAMALPFPDDSFDVVFSIGLLEHFENINIPIEEQIRVLLPGGLFLGYVVPKYTDNIQIHYEWINNVLRGMVKDSKKAKNIHKDKVFRSDNSSEKYINVLKSFPTRNIQSSGIYPLPMLSYSIDFPFTLLPPESELSLVKHFQTILDSRKKETGLNPWLCDEGYGQAFLIWCFKT